MSLDNVAGYAKGSPLLTLEDVGLSFGSKVVLSHVNATISDIEREGFQQGQVVCFLGASGIGKTQLSRIIAGLKTPTTGRVLGEDGQPLQRGAVGMVPQHYGLFEYLTVEGNLELARKRSKHSLDQKTQLVELLELNDHLSKYPKHLSGGQRQRVAIARQFLCSEHIVILDEPFSGLDIKVKERACSLITKVAQLHTKNTIIIVTHDITEGMSVADTVWLMGVEDGIPGARIVEEYDLAAMGLAWKPDLIKDSQFADVVRHVKARFLEVAP